VHTLQPLATPYNNVFQQNSVSTEMYNKQAQTKQNNHYIFAAALSKNFYPAEKEVLVFFFHLFRFLTDHVLEITNGY